MKYYYALLTTGVVLVIVFWALVIAALAKWVFA